MSREREALQSAVLARSPALDGLTLPRFDAPDEVPAEVEQLLSRPLTADDAVRVAMLANREGRAALAEIGIAKGAWVQAGLIPNPEAELSVRAPGGAQPSRPSQPSGSARPACCSTSATARASPS
jgi:hypothetical protein